MISKNLLAIRPSQQNEKSLHICWMLHNICNQRCSYCGPSHYDGSWKSLDLQTAKTFIDRVIQKYGRFRPIHVSFSGGEPPLWRDFFSFCDFLRERSCEIGMTSNGTLPLIKWDKLANQLNWLCLSYHPEFTDDDHFNSVIRLLCNRTKLAVRIMMPPKIDLWDRSMRLSDRLRQIDFCSSLFVEHVPLQENFGGQVYPVKYLPEQQRYLEDHNHFVVTNKQIIFTGQFKKNWWDFISVYSDQSQELCRPNSLIAKGETNFLNWTCHIGLDLLMVLASGEVLRGNCGAGGSLGFLTDSNFTFPNSTVRCPFTFCACGTDIQVEKYATKAN